MFEHWTGGSGILCPNCKSLNIYHERRFWGAAAAEVCAIVIIGWVDWIPGSPSFHCCLGNRAIQDLCLEVFDGRGHRLSNKAWAHDPGDRYFLPTIGSIQLQNDSSKTHNHPEPSEFSAMPVVGQRIFPHLHTVVSVICTVWAFASHEIWKDSKAACHLFAVAPLHQTVFASFKIGTEADASMFAINPIFQASKWKSNRNPITLSWNRAISYHVFMYSSCVLQASCLLQASCSSFPHACFLGCSNSFGACPERAHGVFLRDIFLEDRNAGRTIFTVSSPWKVATFASDILSVIMKWELGIAIGAVFAVILRTCSGHFRWLLRHSWSFSSFLPSSVCFLLFILSSTDHFFLSIKQELRVDLFSQPLELKTSTNWSNF